MDKQIQSFQENDIIQEYLKALFHHNNKKNYETVNDLVKYIAQMERQYQQISTELNEMKELLSAMQTPTHKSRLSMLTQELESSINSGMDKFNELKNDTISLIQDSLNDFKSKSKDSVIKVIDVMHIKVALQKIRKALFLSMNRSQNIVCICDMICLEFRRSHTHLKNVSRLLMGKPIYKDTREEHRINLFQAGIRKMQLSFEILFTNTTKLLHRLEDFERKSVKEIKMIDCKAKKKSYKIDLNKAR